MTAIEYALVAALIAMAIIVGVGNLGTEVGNLYSYISNKVGCAVQGGGC